MLTMLTIGVDIVVVLVSVGDGHGVGNLVLTRGLPQHADGNSYDNKH